MRPPASKYISLDGAVIETKPVRGLIRFVGFASSWLILGGFLALQPLYEKHPRMRSSKIVPPVVSAVLLALGCGLTAVLRFTNTTKEFRAQFIYLPCLSSCALGLVVAPYSFAVSARSEWNMAATASVVVGAVTTAIYASLVIHAYYSVSFRTVFTNRKALPSLSLPTLRPKWPEERPNCLYPSDEYFPSKVRPATGGDDELMAAQMRTLLIRTERPYPGSSSTYHIELPPPLPMARNEYRSSIELPKHVSDYYGPDEGDVDEDPDAGRDLGGRLRAVSHATKSRSRSRSAVSREERRIQIEAGG